MDMNESLSALSWHHIPLLVIGLFFGYHFLYFFVMKWRLRGFKGPFALPIVGNIYTPDALMFLGFLGKLKKRYGRVFTFFGFMRSYLIVCEPDAVRRILSDTKTFTKGSDYSERFKAVFGEGLVTSANDKHKKDKAVFGKYFVRSNIAAYAEMMNKFAMDMIASNLAPSGSQNVEEFFALLSLRVFMTFATNFNYADRPEREKEIAHMVSKASNTVGTFVIFGIPIKWWIPGASPVLSIGPELMKDLNPVVKERRRAMAAGELPDLDDPLTAMIRENLSDQDIQDHMVTLVCAGHDTTAYFTAYMTLLLAENQDSQDKLRDEIMKMCGNKDVVTAEDVYDMKYMQIVMKETFRYYAIIPAVSRCATEEVTIKECDLTIPKGQDIMIPMYLINRDAELWDEPGKYKPERFLNSGDQFTSAKLGYFPFGYGTRVCIGNTLAYIESGIFMAHLLRKFRFEPEPGFKPKINAGISLTTTNGINVILKPI
jgi:cytochrome P450